MIISMKTLPLLCISLALWCGLPTHATIRYVRSVNPAPVPPYTNWTTAAQRIQDAVDVSDPGDTIIVSNGHYLIGTRITPGYAQDNRLVINKDITVRSLSGPDETYIYGGTDIRGVFMTAGTLEGFRIHFGNTRADGNTTYDRSGGGIWLTNGCVVSNCLVTLCNAYNGGGVYMLNGGYMIDCVVFTNSATYGGGIYCRDGGHIHTTAVRYNSAGQHGGGIYLYNQGDVHHATIHNNYATSLGGGVHCKGGGTLDNCIIYDNISGGDAGGVYCVSGAQIISSIIRGNQCSEFGGGVYLFFGGIVRDSILISNTTYYTGGGAAMYEGGEIINSTIAHNTAQRDWGGGVSLHDGGSVINSTFYGNSAPRGGGVHLQSGGALDRCILYNNTALNEGGGVYFYHGGAITNCLVHGMNAARYGAGVFIHSGGAVVNSTIAGNSATHYAGGICTSNGGTVVSAIIYHNTAMLGHNNWRDFHGVATYSYCCTTPTNNLPVAHACIPDNPLFISPVAPFDYGLQEGSPCIDSGFTMPWMSSAIDLAGNPRVYNHIVDMGAYEFIPEPGAGILLICCLCMACRRFSCFSTQ